MQPEDVAYMPLGDGDGDGAGLSHGRRKPSTEWRMHRDILRRRPEFNAVVHGHPPYSTTLAIARKPIPACHYMIAAFGGNDVRCAPYVTYGTQALSDHALIALEGRSACLLANHGMIACGPNLDRAMWLAIELETIARQFYQSLLIGGPVLLSEAEIADAMKGFATYGAGGSDASPAVEAPRRPRMTRMRVARGPLSSAS
jgi:L-fuculose-phosphate aldolase